MKKINFKFMILSSLACLTPIIIGLFFYDRLPDPMPSHWGINGEVDGYMPKNIVIFGMPVFMALLNAFAITITQLDPKRRKNNDKLVNKIYWLVPLLTIFISCVTYAVALGNDLDVSTYVVGFVGVIFIVIGNYLPKVNQNYTIGIKVPWTLNNEEVWIKTHRMAGKIWFGCGIAVFISAFLPGQFTAIILGLVLVLCVVYPIVYSYRIYSKIENNN